MYLTGSVGADTASVLDAGIIGYLRTPLNYQKLQSGWVWAADNGIFGKGWRGEPRWMRWLESHTEEERSRCLFATAPDVVGDWKETLERSRPLLPVLRGLGYQAALIAQDGLTAGSTPWDEFDVLFIGGSTAWKLGADARTLILSAKKREKRVHIGRVNSQVRYLAFASLGCDTADGTYLAFGPRVNLPNLLGWVRHHKTQLTMFPADS